MILVLSVTTGYSYAGLIAGILLSLFATYGPQAVVDRNVDKLRDAVQGGRVRSSVRYAPALRKESRQILVDVVGKTGGEPSQVHRRPDELVARSLLALVLDEKPR